MTADEALASYRSIFNEVGEDVVIRRYSGAGPSRTKVEAVAKARPLGLQSAELVGAIAQGKSRLIVINDPQAVVPVGKVSLASMLPLTTDDKIFRDGREVAIEAVNSNTRRIAGVIIALEIQTEG